MCFVILSTVCPHFYLSLKHLPWLLPVLFIGVMENHTEAKEEVSLVEENLRKHIGQEKKA